MAPKEVTPMSPKTPKSKRASLVGAFDKLEISKGKDRARDISGTSMSSVSSIRDCFAHQWPPALDFGSEFNVNFDGSSMSSAPSRSLRTSRDYRQPSDGWAKNPQIKDEPLNKSAEFEQIKVIMDEIHDHCNKLEDYKEGVADFLVEEMIKMVFGSSKKAQRCTDLGLDETLKLCKQIFAGETVEYDERSPEYKIKMETIVRQGIDVSQNHIIRSRREMVQHAAAFHFIVRRFVHEKEAMTEDLIKATHEILVAGIDASSAGFSSSKSHGGRYRTEEVYIGSQKAPAASGIQESMASFVRQLEQDINIVNKARELDPFVLAAKYCTLFVHIHPFQDANGRMCRLLLNAILIKYTGIVVSLGEHDQNRDEYTEVATESREVGGHHGALSTMVLGGAMGTLKRLKERMSKFKR